MSEISRVTRTKEDAQVSYNRLSRWYDLLAEKSEKKYREVGLRKLDVATGKTVLEIGFGTGQAVLSLARSVGTSGKVYGIDISEGMQRLALERVSRAGFSELVELKRGDAITLPFSANFFDAVFMSFTLELFDTREIPLVLQECQRVLIKNGRICIVAMSKKGKDNLMTRMYGWAHRIIPTYVDCRPIYVQKVLEQVNFNVINVTLISMWGLPVEIVLAKKVTKRKEIR